MCRCSTSGPSNRSGLVFFLECAALAAIVVGLGARSTFAVGLTYVDGLPGSSFGETPNLFRSNGTSLGTPGATDVFTSRAIWSITAVQAATAGRGARMVARTHAVSSWLRRRKARRSCDLGPWPVTTVRSSCQSGSV